MTSLQEKTDRFYQDNGDPDLDLLDSPQVNLINASSLTPSPIRWLWDGWLAHGKAQILGGAPGTGKTTIAMMMAAIVSAGLKWPDETQADSGAVLIWSGEDDFADTLLPRLLSAGADGGNIWFIDNVSDREGARSFDPAKDIKILSREMARIGDVSLLIVDPVVSAIAGDGHKNSDVRRGLQPLVDLACLHNCALLGITHFSKGTSGRDPLERITGSLAFGALARVVMVASKAQNDDENPRVFMRAKSNIGSDRGGFQYKLEQTTLPLHPDIKTSCVQWMGAVDGTAFDVLGDIEQDKREDDGGDDGRTAVGQAMQFLKELLVDGPLPTNDIKKEAKEAGHAWSAVRQAQKKIGIMPKKEKSKKDGKWTWALPENELVQRCLYHPSKNDEHLQHLPEEPHE